MEDGNRARIDALQGTEPLIIDRAHELGEVDLSLREKFYRRFEGTEREVLPEPTGEGWTDNYIRVDVPLKETKSGLGLRPVLAHTYSPVPVN